MAEVVAMRNNALPYPVYGVSFTVVFPMLDADGDLVTGATTPDAERSLNGDTFADCTNESTEIATNSGIYYLTLTAAEMTADIVTVIAKSATAGMKTTTIVLYPRKLVTLATGTCQGANDTGDIQLASGDSAVDDIYNGCLCVAVIDGTTEARLINDYVGSTKVAEISPAWNTAAPDSNDTYTIYLPEGRQIPSADVKAWNGVTVSTPATAGIPDVNVKNINNVAAATPGASGGILISGSNAGTTTLGALTVTGVTTHTGNMVLSDGLTISTPSTTNRAGITITGNGTGAAVSATGGATGQGFLIAGGGTSGDGIKVTTTSGHGINLAPVGTSMHGMLITGGNGGTSDGLKLAAGTGGVGFRYDTLTASGTTTFAAIAGTTLTLSGAVAFQSTFAVTTSTSLGALSATTVTFSGAVAFQSTFAVTTSTALAALSCTTLTASGAVAFQSTFAITGNVSMAAGLNITQSSANTAALVVTGNGSGNGATFTGGAAVTTTAGGNGIAFTGGAASTSSGGTAGRGMVATGGAGAASTNGAAGGVLFIGGGTNTVASSAHGFAVTGTSTGDGLNATSGGGATGNGITATAASTNGSGMSHVSTGTGSGILTDKLTASGAVTFQSTFAVTTSTALAALSCTTLTASGAVAFQSTFAVTTSTSLAALSATTVTFSGAVAFQSTFAVTTSTSLAALSATTVTFSGAVAFQSTFAVTGATTFAAVACTTLTASGAVAFQSTFTITGVFTASAGFVNTYPVGAYYPSNVVDSGTAQSATGTTLVLRSAAAFADSELVGATVVIRSATAGAGQRRRITANVGSTDTVTVDTWTTTPTGTIVYDIIGTDLTNLDAAVSSRGTSTLTQTQVTGGAYALNSASFAFNAGLDFTTTQKAATLARVTLVDTATTITNLPSIPANWLTAAGTAADFDTEIAAAVWDLATSGHTTSGTFGAAMVAAGSAGDPWATSLPGAYGAGTAGFIVGTNLDTTVSSRLATASYTAPPSAATVASAVWDLDATAHQTQGTFGQAIGDPGSDSDSIWSLANTNLDATVSSRLPTSSYTAPPSAATIATTVLTTQMTESYAADGTAPTLAQALFLTMQSVGEFSIAGVTITVKKLDGSTTAATYTLDDGTTPTSRTRAT